jgi:SAM-dependent methyltransferase
MEALQTIGSNVMDFGCPYCACHDRERHLLLYMTAQGLIDRFRGSAILHFAPEHRLSAVIEATCPGSYVKGDLFPTSEDIETINMLAIDYPSETFDFVIANHVLEHVDDDLLALAELRRVLKIGGFAILQTPYSVKLSKTFSDPGIDSELARYHAYGQADHVRLYGVDIVDRIESAGFESRMATHEELLAGVDPRKFGVNEKEPFFLFKRSDS